MKNLKKVLALVLVVATLLTMTTIASAKFTDADKVKYTEAVDVLTAINVINGYTDGSFRPEGNVTRAQMAKMVAYIVAGGEDVGALYSGANSFSDCTTHWARGYIAYANKTGIVAGVGGGKFNPDGNVTGTQAAKMMLVALGYDAAIENYTGANWAVNVLSDARDAGLLKGLESVNMSAAMTREQAAQLMFNALQANMVKYSQKGSTIDLGNGVSINTGASTAEAVTTTETWGGNIKDEHATNVPYTVQLGEKYFSKLVKTSGAGTTDAFGRPSDNWSYKNEDICSVVSEAAATFTAKTSATDVAKALKGYYFKNGNTEYKVNDDDKYTNVYFTDETKGKILVTVSGTGKSSDCVATNSDTACTVADRVSRMTGNGTLVEVYANSEKQITDIVILNYAIGEVTKVSTNKAGDVTYTVGGSSYTDYADKDKTDTVEVTGTVAQDSYVTYVKVGAKAYLYATTSVQGVQTRKDQDNKITVGGTVYSLQANADASKFNNSTDTFNYFIDQYGYVVATTSTATASTNYAYVISVNGSVSTTIDGTTPYVEARVVLGDGTVGVYEVALEKVKSDNDTNGDYKVKNVGTLVYDVKNASETQTSETVTKAAKALLGKVYGYTLSNNTITFETKGALDGAKVDAVVTAALTETIAKDKIEYTVTGGKVVANQNTKFVVYNADKKTATIYTGSNKLPTFNAEDKAVAVATVTSSGRATASIVFVGTATGATAATTDSYVYIDTDKFVVSGSGDSQVFEYTGTYADGTTATLTSSDKLASAKALFYVNDDKSVGNKIGETDQFLGEKALTLADGILSVAGGKSYYVTDDTQIVYIDSDLAEVNGNTGFVVLKESNSTTVAAIFVTKD